MIVFVNILYSGRRNPEDFNLPSDYNFAEKSWGNFFYKIYTTKFNYNDAKTQCESDGAFLAIPRSQAENDFLTGLVPNGHIWIGINDIREEGNFIAVDGRDITYTNWYSNQPTGTADDGTDEDGVEIYNWANGQWNDAAISSKEKFVCSIHIEGIFYFIGNVSVMLLFSNTGNRKIQFAK